MSRLAVVVIGAGGRMGQLASRLLETTSGFALAASVHSAEELAPVLEHPAAQLGLDFTVAGRGFEHGLALLAAGLRPVIGTSGVDFEETEQLDRRARELGLGGLVVPNFSLGMACLQAAAVRAARAFDRAEIVELHHEKKRDAPSATAQHTAQLLCAEGGMSEVPVHSVRLPGLYAHQEVLLGSPGETLTLRHDMLGPEAFAPGILLALRHAATAVGVAHGLRHALEGET